MVNTIYKEVDEKIKQAYVDYIGCKDITMETISDYVARTPSEFSMSYADVVTYCYKKQKVVSLEPQPFTMSKNPPYTSTMSYKIIIHKKEG